MRLTRDVRQQLLDQNEGFKRMTSNLQRNSSEDRTYEIRSGELHIRAQGKTSWADSRYDQEYVADDEQTRRFLRDYMNALNTEGLA